MVVGPVRWGGRGLHLATVQAYSSKHAKSFFKIPIKILIKNVSVRLDHQGPRSPTPAIFAQQIFSSI